MQKLLFVGFGGMVGAMLRYGISLIPYKGNFPLLTFMTNVIGAIMIGVVVAMAANAGVSGNALLFLKTGVCGGFTTFSTFSLEAYDLFNGKKPMLALLYVILSVTCCVVGVMVGMQAVGGRQG